MESQSNEVKVINPEEAPVKGRPTAYKPTFGKIAYQLALVGHTNKEIAETFGVSLTTFKAWMKRYPEFLSQLRVGKEIADGMVAEGLFKRACGYEYQSEKLMTVAKGDGVSEVERHSITVHVPADPGAALNWLKNRQPKLWRDKQDVSLSGEILVTMNLNGETKPTASDEY